MSIQIPELRTAAIEAAAERCLRERCAARTIPIDVEAIIDKGYRIDVVPEYGLLKRFGAVMYITHDLKEIRVDQSVFDNDLRQYRFNLAHELAHHILHADVYSNLHFQSTEEWMDVMRSISDDDYDKMEWQANMFSRFLLVPRNELRARFNSWRDRMSQAGIELRTASPAACDRIIRALSSEFDIGSGTILGRVRNENLWPGPWPFDPPSDPRPDNLF
jgi:hypothetical protein